ncbi:uncharacterized protein LOC135395837 [Ornithodoros turicata]|uniref:uncharacterized protein LOC135395837 n=1 Tax=Ornithodoros turicata TaxID=34597 RepID=UPI003139CF5F
MYQDKMKTLNRILAVDRLAKKKSNFSLDNLVTGKYHFISVLPKIVRDYNNTKHRTLGISPSEVTPENKFELFNKINGKPVVPPVKKKLKVGDKVRVLLHRKGFHKSSEGTWSSQIFTVSHLRDTSPPVEHLQDYRGKEVEGSFYPRGGTHRNPRRQLALASNKSAEKEEEVNGLSFSLVRWFGYDKEHDSWVPSSDVVKIGK